MQVKEVVDDAEGVIIKGYASTPDIDRYRDIVEPEAFQKAIEQFMKNAVMLRSHDSDRPVGGFHVVKVVKGKGLWVEGKVIEKETAADVKAGLFKTFSIGYIPLFIDLMWLQDDGSLREFNFKTDDYWSPNAVRVIKELDLVEISIVATPANPGALFTLEKSLKSLTNQLAFKSFSMKKSTETEGEVPDNEVENPVKPTEEAAPSSEGGENAPAPEEEKAAEQAGEATEKKDETEAKAEESTDTAEKPAEIAGAEADDAGEDAGAEAAAEADADGAEGQAEDESKGGVLVVSKEVADRLVALKGAGLIREPEGEEKAMALTKSVVELMEQLCALLVTENKRANDEEARANQLQAKLEVTPDKKALGAHRQFASEAASTDVKAVDEAAKAAQKKAASEKFMSMFHT